MNPQRSHAAEQFLLAAKQAEMRTLKNLAANCEVVAAVSGLIHELQRERGLSNIYLASSGQRCGEQRQAQLQRCLREEHGLRRQLESLQPDGGAVGGMRLLNSVAFVLQGLDNLPELRRQVDQREIAALDTTRALCRLIAGLLSVVFAAADVAGDPEVTRVLVALFNFAQGKEYAGQERAWAAIGFAKGRFDPALCERLSHLHESQTHSFEIFAGFADAALGARWRGLEESRDVADLERMRTLIQGLADGGPIASEISEIWYELATRRIDAMRDMEIALVDGLLRVSQQQVERARADLDAHRNRLQALADIKEPPAAPLNILFDPEAPGLYGADGVDATASGQALAPELARSVYDLVRGQAEHIKRMNDQLDEARRALTDRKRIERAKGLLMQSLNLSEEQAYRRMQRRAMDMNLRLADMASRILEAADSNQAPAGSNSDRR